MNFNTLCGKNFAPMGAMTQSANSQRITHKKVTTFFQDLTQEAKCSVVSAPS